MRGGVVYGIDIFDRYPGWTSGEIDNQAGNVVVKVVVKLLTHRVADAVKRGHECARSRIG
jgi:hypothetical protein